jgi:hypothetical protein
MLAAGASQKKAIRPDFNRVIIIDFQGAKPRPGNVHSPDGALEFIKPIV